MIIGAKKGKLEFLIFTDNPTLEETLLVFNEARNRRMNVSIKVPWDMSLPKTFKSSSIVYVPSNIFNKGSYFEFLNRYLILEELGKDAKVIVNPLESLLHYSKAYFSIIASKQGIPHPKTIITENIDVAYEFASKLIDEGKSCVLKPIARGEGTGISKLTDIRDAKDLRQFLLYHSRIRGLGVFYLQEFIENLGYDLRLFLIDGRVIGRMKRTNSKDFRYNASLGGEVENYSSDAFDSLALEVAEALNYKIAGIDILPSKEGKPIVLEANCYPKYTHLSLATGIEVHKKIVDYLESIENT
ncbi:MAG: ribosomal protein S6--L-glutamate ligase [Thermoproteota archaeon]|nr:ribosomal protein S6--L-glutamate ligase [Thermoproteota archaeon]